MTKPTLDQLPGCVSFAAVVPSAAFVGAILAVAALVAIPTPAVAATTTASQPGHSEESLTRLMDEAKQKDNAGKHDESALAYSEIFHTLTDTDRSGPLGDHILFLAKLQYEKAYKDLEQTPQDTEQRVRLQKMEISLLAKVKEDDGPAAKDPDIIEWSKRLVVESPAVDSHSGDSPTVDSHSGDSPAVDSHSGDSPAVDSHSGDSSSGKSPAVILGKSPAGPLQLGPLLLDPRTAVAWRRNTNTLFGLGASSLVGGVVMVAVGARVYVNSGKRAHALAAQTSDIYDAAEQTIRSPDQIEGDQSELDRFNAENIKYLTDSRRNAISVIVPGCIIGAAGVGLMTWGIVRHARAKSRTGRRAQITPAVTLQHFGLQLASNF